MLLPLATERRFWEGRYATYNAQSWHAQGLAAWWSMHYAYGQTLHEPIRNQFASMRAGGAGLSYTGDPQYGTVITFVSAGYDAPAVNFSAPLTVAVWCRPTFTNAVSSLAFGKLVVKPHGAGTADPYTLLALGVDNASPAHWTAGISTGISGSGVGPTSAATVVANALTHVAMTYDGAAVRLYVNGVPDGSVATSLTIGTNAVALNFGCLAAVGANNFWGGSILDIRWYERVLTDAEMAQLVDPATRWDLYALGPLMPGVLGAGTPLVPTRQPVVSIVS